MRVSVVPNIDPRATVWPCPQRDRLREAAARTESTKPVGLEDVFFQLRHDGPLVRRISRALAWKDVRKSAKAGNENDSTADDGDPVADLDVGSWCAFTRCGGCGSTTLMIGRSGRRH